MPKTPLFSFRLNQQLKDRLLEVAVAEGRSLSYIIDKALIEFLQRNSEKQEIALPRRSAPRRREARRA